MASNEAALMIKLLADKAGLDVVLKDAEGSVQKFEQAVNRGTTSQMRSWRESNRMSGSLNNMALQFGGVGRQASMVFGVMDNLGDYFERAAIRGDSVKTALKNLSGELGMMAAGGVIMGVSMLFEHMGNKAKEALAEAEKALAKAEQATKSFMDTNAQLLKLQKDVGAISETAYIDKLKERYIVMSGVNTVGMFGNKIAVDYYGELDKLTKGTQFYTQAQREKLIPVLKEILDYQVKIKKESAKKLPDIPLGPDIPKDFFKGVDVYAEFDDMIAQHRQDTLEQIADYEEQQRQESIDRVQGYYNTVSTSLANATVSSLTSGIQAWRDWAKNVIAEIERVILKQLFLNAITSIFGGTAGGGGILGAIGNLLTGGSKAAAVGNSPQIQIMPISGNISAEGQLAFVKFANAAYGNSTPKAQAQLYRNVQRGKLQDVMR